MCHFHFGPATSFFLELLANALCSYSVAYWTPSDLGRGGAHLLVSYLFAFLYLYIKITWSGLPFPSPVDHILSELFTMIHLSWVALHGMAHSLIELCKPLHCDKAVIYEGDNTRFSSVQFSRSVVSDSLRPHESQHTRPRCPSLNPGVHSDSRPSSQ